MYLSPFQFNDGHISPLAMASRCADLPQAQAEYSNTRSQRILLLVCYLGSLKTFLSLTFAARVGDKGRRNLFYPLAFALRTGHFPFCILGKSLKQRELMLTVLGFALIFVIRHAHSPF